MSTAKVLLGIVAGAAIGLTAGVLVAPDSGAKTRKKLKKKMDAKKSELEDLLQEVKSKSDELADQAKSKYNSTIDNAKI